MKKQLLTLTMAIASILSFGQSIPNGNFENWNTTSFENPQSWMCANDENAKNGATFQTVTKSAAAYHGSFSVRMASTLVGQDTLQAWFANGNPGDMSGGVPYSQTPTGVRFYYKSSLAAGDSAITLAIFKKNGSTIGMYFFKIGANHSNYTLFNATFTPALSQAPDSVIFACASSDLMNHKAYPGSTLEVDSLNFTGVSSQPANFNGDFENWQIINLDKCAGWNGGTAIKTTDKYKGTYAIELVTNAPGFGNNQVQVGRAMTGHDVHNGPPAGGYPYTNQIDTLVFYYKYLPANYPLSTDSARFWMSFTKNGSNVWGIQKLLGPSLGYRKVSIPINIGTAPDTVLLSFESSNWPAQNSYIGSDLKVDQVYFKSQVIPVSNFIMPSHGCKGVPIQLVDSSSNMPTSWQWFMTGASPNNSVLQNPSITYTNTGTFTVSLQASDSFGVGNFISKTITIYSLPTVTASSTTVCPGGIATLTANGASTYNWSNGMSGATMTVSPTSTTTYSVLGTSAVGCSNANTATVYVPQPVTPSICMVTVDSLSNNNIIYWDKTAYTNADSFIVYREVSTGNYSRIGAKHKSAISLFKDSLRNIGPANGDPSIGSYRYKLQLRDTCGNYSTMSPYHNTVKITDQQNGNFQWNTYDVEGQSTPVANFILERDNANNGIWTTVGIVSGTQTSLFDGSYGTYQAVANWRVQATGFNCTPSLRYGNNSTQAAVIKSKSNITNNRTMVVNSASVKGLSVYPNPSNGILNIEAGKTLGTVNVMNALGTIVYSSINTDNKVSLDLTGLPAGVYTVQVQNAFIKFIKE